MLKKMHHDIQFKWDTITTSIFTGIKEIKRFVSLVFHLSNGDYTAGSLRDMVRDLNISVLIQVTGCYVKGWTVPNATALSPATLQDRLVNGQGSKTQRIILQCTVGSPHDQSSAPTAQFPFLFLTTTSISAMTQLSDYQELHGGLGKPLERCGICIAVVPVLRHYCRVPSQQILSISDRGVQHWHKRK